MSIAIAPSISLEAFLENPIDHTEWIDGQLLEKNAMTAKTARIQARLARFWGNYADSSGIGGEVYVEGGCRTIDRVRCPDVAYLSAALVAQHGDFKVLPHSFLLIAEIISSTDQAEEVFTKVREYLASQCQEVWLVFPESQYVLVITAENQVLKSLGETVNTRKVLQGFSIYVDDLLA